MKMNMTGRKLKERIIQVLDKDENEYDRNVQLKERIIQDLDDAENEYDRYYAEGKDHQSSE